MDRIKVAVTFEWSLNSSRIRGMPGANMDEPRGVIMVKMESTATLLHFLRMVQFIGFVGSSGPSQVTTLGSFSSPASPPFSPSLVAGSDPASGTTVAASKSEFGS